MRDNEDQRREQRQDRIRISADTDQRANIENRDKGKLAAIITAKSANADGGREGASLFMARPFQGIRIRIDRSRKAAWAKPESF